MHMGDFAGAMWSVMDSMSAAHLLNGLLHPLLGLLQALWGMLQEPFKTLQPLCGMHGGYVGC